LSIKYNIQISINHFDNVKKNGCLQNILLVDEFNKYIEDYNSNLESMNTNERYIKNTINQLKCDLWLFLTDKKAFNIRIPLYNNINNNINKHKSKNQEGKYFKKWSQLSNDEQLERFMCFSKYYVQEQYKEQYKGQSDSLSSQLYELLSNAYISKNIIYRDFKWNIKTGCIEKINKLKYDKENGFVLYKDQDKDKNADKDKDKNADKDQDKNTDKESIKKKISYKTIINKDTEKVINEEMLCFILNRYKNKNKNNDTNGNENNSEYKSEFLEIIKIKLKLRKISLDDKARIYKIYDEMYNVIRDNRNYKIE
jgi:hypothetical protein